MGNVKAPSQDYSLKLEKKWVFHLDNDLKHISGQDDTFIVW